MKLRKLAKCSLATALIFGSVGAISGCKKDDETAEKTEREQTYNLYVQYMDAKGETPLTYEQWLASIKGEKGDKGDKGDPGDDAVAPKVRINETTNYWEISTDNGVTWNSTGVKATGDEGDDGHTPVITIGQNGNWFIDGVDSGKPSRGENGEDVSYSTYTVTYDYGITKTFFNDVKDSTLVESNKWIDGLPTIKDEYKNIFLGWYIDGTDIEITKYSFIGRNVTLVAKFERVMSGLYDDGKYVMSWEELTSEYPSAFDGNTILSKSSFESYFTKLSGELVIDNSITTINQFAFSNCKFTNIYIPEKISDIKAVDFISNTLENIFVSEKNKVYKSVDGVVYDKLEKTIVLYPGGKDKNVYTIPERVTEIGEGAFRETNNLTTVNLPTTLLTIRPSAFMNCNDLETIEIPEGIDILSTSIFAGCKKLKTVSLPSTLETIYVSAFQGCEGLTSITIPEGVDFISLNAFSGCINLEQITLPSTLTSMANYVFSGCTKLREITYLSTKENWNNANFNELWNAESNITKIHCTDGDITIY